MSSMPSQEELCERVKDYLEGTAKMKKRPKEERDTNRLLKTIHARVNPVSVYYELSQPSYRLTSTIQLNTWILANFKSTPLAHCQESELIWAAFKQGILKSLLLVDHTEASVHGLSSNRNTMNSQDNEDSTSNSNDYDEFKILCDLYEQERTDEP